MKKKLEVKVKKTKTVEEKIVSKTSNWGFDFTLEEIRRNGRSAFNLITNRQWGEKRQNYWAVLLTKEEIKACCLHGWPIIMGGPLLPSSYSIDLRKRISDMQKQIKKRDESPEETFKKIVDGDGELIPVFLCSWDHSFFISSEQKTYNTIHMDYIEAHMDNSDYDIQKCLEHLKKLKDPNLNLCEEIKTIPYYNQDKGRSKYLEFQYCLELKSKDTGHREVQNKVKEILGIEQFKIQRKMNTNND